jgi:hypothetical protein
MFHEELITKSETGPARQMPKMQIRMIIAFLT